ncbi:MAG: hypothetical protein LQ351_003939 [Letrouitia transgressa]|nr:MAG: hypothetical protein LQ351_003939 [Letrouitia transgressa]
MLLQERPRLVPETSDLDGFFQLLVKIATSQSLHISIVALHLWTKILTSHKLGTCNPVTSLIPQLLEICSHRMIKYETLPEDSTNPSIVFLSYDTDTMPEKHNFLGNYARFCAQIVGSIVENQPVDAIYHILSQAEQVITHLYDGEPAFNVETYSKSSVPFLKLDAQCNVIEAGLKGCGKWLLTQSSPEKDRHNEVMLQNLKVWCERILDLTFEDPLVKERVIQLAVGFATGPLKQDALFAVKVFEYILNTRYPDSLVSVTYSDAVKDLQTFCAHQLQKLAMRFSDYMITIYDEIERKVNQVSQEVAHDEQSRTRYSSILFIITHRATSVALAPREEHLDAFLQPLITRWANNEMTQSLSSFDSFCSLIGLGGIQQYMSQRNAHLIQDWSSHALDDEGKALQTQTQNALEHLPLRATKILLSISVEKLDPASQPFAMACRLWQKHLPLILPNLLRFISHAHAFHNDTNWASLPQEMKGVVKRILTDRFWQVGISIGSRDEFYAKVGRTKLTLEGLASSIRSTLRAVRETGYQLLEYLSLLDESFYGFKELPKPLSHALFSDANALSTHQMVILVDRLKVVVENCPVSCRSHFLPPIVATLFEQLDRKASSEWDSIEERNKATAGADGLDEEMRDESILRQLTYTSVTLVVNLLDPAKPNRPGPALADNPNGLSHVEHGTIRSFMIATPEILKPLILFCTHALRMRDTRSCSLITRVLRSLVPEFDTTEPLDTDVREFISHEVLRACITSLHDPYFVDLQKDLAQLVSSIIITYSPRTDTPKGVLLSLPSMTAERVDRAIAHLYRAHSNHRQQRAVVLELFKDLRGVSVSEQGRIAKPDTKKLRSAMQERYMTVDMQTDSKQKELSPDLGGVADMFGQP